MKQTVDNIIRQLRRQRRAPDGKWETIVEATRRDMRHNERMDELLTLPISDAQVITAEGCAVV